MSFKMVTLFLILAFWAPLTATTTTLIEPTMSATVELSSSTTPASSSSATPSLMSATSTVSPPNTISPTPSAASSTSSRSSTVTPGGQCAALNSTKCVAKVCCKKGSSGGWSGVDSSKKIGYNETTCTGGKKAYVSREKPCNDVCVEKDCDSGADGLILQTTALLLSLLACWILTSG